MDKNFRLRSTRKRVTELLLSESGAVDVRRTIGLGVAVTSSMLVAMLLTPHNASAGVCNDPRQFQCGDDNHAACCWNNLQRCCMVYNPDLYRMQYWCCGINQQCGAVFGQCGP
jgi:hypothetical protein